MQATFTIDLSTDEDASWESELLQWRSDPESTLEIRGDFDQKPIVPYRYLEELRSAPIGNISFSHCELLNAPFFEICFAGTASFWGVVFGGDTFFGGSTFKKNVSFNYSRIDSHVDFVGTTFKGKADFHNTIFEDRTDFEGARFESSAGLRAVTFQKRVDFTATEFRNHASFNKTEFCREARFLGTKFLSRVRFDKAKFMDSAEFIGTEFAHPAVFYGAECADDMSFIDTAGDLALAGLKAERVRIQPREQSRLISLCAAAIGEEVFIGERLSIADCDFRDFQDIDKLSLVGGDLFVRHGNKVTDTLVLANPPLGVDERVPATEMASIYRQLRVSLEERGNRPAAAIFYRGEMQSRLDSEYYGGDPERHADNAGKGSGAETLILLGYKALSGFGMKPLRPLLWFTLTVILVTWLLLMDNLDLVAGNGVVDSATFPEAAIFSAKSMVSFFRPPEAELSWREDTYLFFARLIGPLLIAQLFLSIRERVAR